MANSIGDWYADRADGRDGNADDETVERAMPWDVPRSGTMRPAPVPKTRRNAAPPAPRGAAGRELNPAMRAAVRAARRRHPTVTFRLLVSILAAEGVNVTRAEVSAVLRTSEASRATTNRAAAANSSAASRRKPPAIRNRKSIPRGKAAKRIVAAAEKAQQAGKAAEREERRRAKTADASGRAAAGRANEGSGAPAWSAAPVPPPFPPPSVAPRRLPVKLPPMALRIEEPVRRKVSQTGWRRSVEAVPEPPRPTAVTPVPCYACGIVPTVMGGCRCV